MITEISPNGRRAQIEASLRRLVFEEGWELRQHPLSPGLSENRKSLLNFYKESSRLSRLWREAVHLSMIPFQDHSRPDFDSLKEPIYQDLAYYFSAAHQPDDRVVLSPGNTLRFYRVLYPIAQFVHFPLGVPSLQGIGVPGGLVIQRQEGKPHIAMVSGYVVSDGRNNVEGVAQQFCNDKENFDSLFSDAALEFVVPQDHEVPVLTNTVEAEIERLPFGYDQLQDFIESIYRFHSPLDDGATLADFQLRARKQLATFQRNSFYGHQNPAEQRYISWTEQAQKRFTRSVATTA